MSEIEAGARLDFTLADKLMEWNCAIIGNVCYSGFGLWAPSTDIKHAFEVLEKLHALYPDYYIDLHLWPGKGSKYLCSIVESAEGAIFHANATAETAPLAICRAALQMIEPEQKANP